MSGELNLNNKVSNLEENLPPLKQTHPHKKTWLPYIKTPTTPTYQAVSLQQASRQPSETCLMSNDLKISSEDDFIPPQPLSVLHFLHLQRYLSPKPHLNFLVLDATMNRVAKHISGVTWTRHRPQDLFRASPTLFHGFLEYPCDKWAATGNTCSCIIFALCRMCAFN